MTTEGRPFAAAAANRVYEDIELASSAEWVQEEGYDTLIVNLQGYKKENLRIQVTSTRNIRVLGERPVGPQNNTWQRFRKEFPVPSNCDVNETSARFDNGFLYVKIPKTIAPVETAANKDHKPQKPATGITAPPLTEAIPKPRMPISSTTTYAPQTSAVASSAQKNLSDAQRTSATAQRTNATAQGQIPPSNANTEKKTDGSSKVSSESQAKYAKNDATAEPKSQEKDKVLAAVTTDQPSKVSKSSATYEGAAEGSTNGGPSNKTPMDKEKSDDVFSAIAQNVEEKSDVNRGTRVDEKYNSTKEDAKTEEYCSMRTQGRGYYRQVVDGLIMELKEPRKLVNLAVAFGFVLVLGLYVKYAVNSIEEFRQEL